jgi:cbb3-type cytochrome oxidase subunit 3
MVMKKQILLLLIFLCCILIFVAYNKSRKNNEKYTNLELHSDHETLDYICHECNLPCK